MEAIWIALISAGGSVVASGGFWTIVQKIDARRGANSKLLLGLAHDRIIDKGMSYLERGWLTKDEYEDLMKYLVEPYSKFGGNGLAEKVVNDVKKLPIYSRPRTEEEIEIIQKGS